jgi:glycosyltransferase involved in cell wall biosynthesis
VGEDFHPPGTRGTPARRLRDLLAVASIAWRWRGPARNARAIGAVWLFEPVSLAGIVLAACRPRTPFMAAVIGSPASSFALRAARARDVLGRSAYRLGVLVARAVEALLARRAKLLLVAGEHHRRRLGRGVAFSTAGFSSQDVVVRDDTLTDTTATWVYAGTVSAAKGVDTLLTALRQVRDAGLDHRALLVGPVDARFALKDLVANLALGPYVDAVGRQPWRETLGAMRGGDVFVFLSHHEGMPKAPLEAMSQGLPVVVTPTGADQYVVDGENGLIVPVGDAAACAVAVRRLAEDGPLRRKLIASALDTARRHAYDTSVARVRNAVEAAFPNSVGGKHWTPR